MIKSQPRPSEAFLVPPLIHGPSSFPRMSKPRIIKNVIVLSTGVMVLFTAYEGLSMLQSTVNSDQGIGVLSQAVLNLCFCASALLFPKYVIKRLGSKLTLVLSMLSYIPYVASNVYPHWIVMMPTSVLIGLGAALLWGSQANYLNDVSVLYAELLTGSSEALSSGEEELCAIKEQSMGGCFYGSLDKPSQKDTSNQESDPSNFDRCLFSPSGERRTRKFGQSEEIILERSNLDSLDVQGNDVRLRSHSSTTESSPSNADEHRVGDPSAGRKQKHGRECPSSEQIGNYLGLVSNSEGSKEPCTRSPVGKDIELKRKNSELESDMNRKSEIESESVRRKKAIESTTARFFGFHGMAYLTSYIWSNLLSYSLMQGDSHITGRSTCACGADYCDADLCHGHQESQAMSDNTRYLLTGVCVGLGLSAVLLVWLFLDPLDDKSGDCGFDIRLLTATVRLATRKDLLLLMPMSLYLGMAKAFFNGDITKAFIGCALGPSSVGRVAAVYGAFCALSALLSGWAGRGAGRPALFTGHALLNVASSIVLLTWTPDPERPIMIFVVAGMWGLYVGTAFSQIRAFYGVLFKADEEAAFATFHTWYSLGFFVSFVYSNFLCTYVKIYVLLTISTAGFLGYLAVERRHHTGRIHQ